MADRKYNSTNKKLDETQNYNFADLLQVQQPQQTQQPASPQTGAQAPGLDYSPLQTDSYGKPYSSYRDAQQQNGGQWYGMAQDLLAQYQNMPGFQFDLNANGLYNLYKDMYTKQGQQAMRDTMGQAAGLTGGYASSYAQNVGQQAYNGYLEKLNAVVPDIYAKERSAYDQSRQDLLSQMQLLNQMGDRAYQQSRDRLSDDRYQQELAYQQSRDAIADQRYNQEWNYNVANADRERAYNLAMQMIQIGKLPSDEQLAAAGMDKASAQALATWYANQLAGIGYSGGGGGSGGGGRTYRSYGVDTGEGEAPVGSSTVGSAYGMSDQIRDLKQGVLAYIREGRTTEAKQLVENYIAMGLVPETVRNEIYKAYGLSNGSGSQSSSSGGGAGMSTEEFEAVKKILQGEAADGASKGYLQSRFEIYRSRMSAAQIAEIQKLYGLN